MGWGTLDVGTMEESSEGPMEGPRLRNLMQHTGTWRGWQTADVGWRQNLEFNSIVMRDEGGS